MALPLLTPGSTVIPFLTGADQCFKACCRLNCISPKFRCGSPTPKDGIWRWAFGRILGLNEVIRVGPWPDGIGVLIEEAEWPECGSLSEHRGKACEDAGGRWPSTRREETPQRKVNWSAPGLWTSGLLDCERISVARVSHPVYGILLRQPELARTRPKRMPSLLQCACSLSPQHCPRALDPERRRLWVMVAAVTLSLSLVCEQFQGRDFVLLRLISQISYVYSTNN